LGLLPVPDQLPTPDPHEFVFELDRAIRDQVITKLEASPQYALAQNVGPAKSGVYVLYMLTDLVYIGKASRETTESERDLRERLNEHVSKISGRKNIRLVDIKCRYLTIESDWFVWAAERALIEEYHPRWNASGFGNKDYGRGRDKQAPSDFDNHYPVDETMPCIAVRQGPTTIHQLLIAVKQALPYVFRYQREAALFQAANLAVPGDSLPAEELLQLIVNALGPDWQATIFKSHVILYQERDAYQHAVKILHSA
jgi:Eco29kI restriction endonuclease